MIGVVVIDGYAFIKKIMREKNQLRLISFNPNYADFFADKSNEIQIVGKIVF